MTTAGTITPDALQALHDLKAAGLHVIPITGRPMGLSASLVGGDDHRGLLPWPVDAIVAETGAAAVTLQSIGLQAVAQQVLRDVPGARLAQDSAGRETDIAIDHSEFTQLPPQAIAQAIQIMQAAGMTVTMSSIHINGGFGHIDKLSGARWIVRQLFGRDLDAERSRWAFVGDSANDQVMFEHFSNSVGVANVRRFEAQLTHLPRYITPSARGAGFAEVARAILAARD